MSLKPRSPEEIEADALEIEEAPLDEAMTNLAAHYDDKIMNLVRYGFAEGKPFSFVEDLEPRTDHQEQFVVTVPSSQMHLNGKAKAAPKSILDLQPAELEDHELFARAAEKVEAGFDNHVG